MDEKHKQWIANRNYRVMLAMEIKKVLTNLENWDFNKNIEQSCEPKLSQKLESKSGTKVANKNCDQKNASKFPA